MSLKKPLTEYFSSILQFVDYSNDQRNLIVAVDTIGVYDAQSAFLHRLECL